MSSFSRKLNALIAICLIAVFTLSLAGCGSVADKDDQSKPVELIWYVIGDPSPDLPMVNDEINKITKAKINTTVKIMPIPLGGYDQKIITLESAGEPCDLVYTCSWINKYNVSASRGFFLPLDELIEKYGKDMQKSIPDYMWNATKIKGKIYAVPAAESATYQAAFIINKKFTDECNFDVSKAVGIKGMMPLFEMVKAKHPDYLGLQCWPKALPADKIDTFIDWKFPGAVRMDDPNCKAINQWEDKDWIDWLKQYREMYVKGFLPKDGHIANAPEPSQKFDNGKMVSFVDLYSPYCDFWNSLAKKFPCVSVKVCEKPVITTSGSTGSLLAISAASKNPERAMKFINLLYTDKSLQNLLAYGIEGTHYEKVSDNVIKLKDRLLKDGYKLNAGWCGAKQNLLYDVDTDMPAKLKDPAAYKKTIADYEATAIKSPALGFWFDPEPVKSEVSSLTSISEQYAFILFAGAADVEPTLKELNDKMKDAGLDKVIAEMQKQLDEWKKTK